MSKITVEEYLALDRAAEVKSEFFDGETFATSGVSFRHDRIQTNLIVELKTLFRGRDCGLFTGEVRVRVSPRMYVRPDLSIVLRTFSHRPPKTMIAGSSWSTIEESTHCENKY